MRTGLTIAVHFGGEITELLAGFETPIDQQRATFKRLRAIEKHEVFERVEFWESGAGRVLKHEFTRIQAPVEVPIDNPAGAIMAAATLPPAAEEPAQVNTEADPDSDHPEANGFDTAPRRRGRPSNAEKAARSAQAAQG